jgi:DNA-binding CsgD family transcriptional regulator
MKTSSETLVSSIYDCAANPDLWSETLANIREAVDAAYVAVSCATHGASPPSQSTRWLKCNGQADDAWLDRLNALSRKIPHGDELFNLPVDVSWTPLSKMSEPDFQKSEFYHEWVKPQNLRDFLSLNYLKRDTSNGFLTIPTSAKRAPVNAQNRRLVEQLSPHIRRALLINDLTDHSNLATALCRQVLDKVSVAVFVVGHGRHLLFTNAAGEKLLSVGDKISTSSGVLKLSRVAGHISALDDALDRALNCDRVSGFAGSVVPLIGNDGNRAAAYILPLAGRDVLGPGHCAVFVTGHAEQHPMATEMLRSMFDLTISEARIVMMIAKGDGPQNISDVLGIRVNTVRTHLKHSFAKTDTSDQTALAGRINALLPPII